MQVVIPDSERKDHLCNFSNNSIMLPLVLALFVAAVHGADNRICWPGTFTCIVSTPSQSHEH